MFGGTSVTLLFQHYRSAVWLSPATRLQLSLMHVACLGVGSRSSRLMGGLTRGLCCVFLLMACRIHGVYASWTYLRIYDGLTLKQDRCSWQWNIRGPDPRTRHRPPAPLVELRLTRVKIQPIARCPAVARLRDIQPLLRHPMRRAAVVGPGALRPTLLATITQPRWSRCYFPPDIAAHFPTPLEAMLVSAFPLCGDKALFTMMSILWTAK